MDVIINVLHTIQIKNFMCVEEIKSLKISGFYNNLIKNLICLLKTKSLFNVQKLNKMFIIRSYLFHITNISPGKLLDEYELEFFKKGVLDNLEKNKGFVNRDELESNKLFSFFRSFYQKGGLFTDIKNLNEVKYFHSLIVLIVLLEYELYIHYYEDLNNKQKSVKAELTKILKTKNIILDLKETRRYLKKLLTPELQKLLGISRVGMKSKIYSSFDTEYQMESSVENRLLAYTACTYSKQFIFIKNLDFELKETSTTGMIVEIIKILRFLNKKYDVETDRLYHILSTNTEIEKIVCKKYTLFSKKEEDMKKLFKTSFVDLEKSTDVYSLKSLIMDAVGSQKDRLSLMIEYYQNLINLVKLPKVSNRKEVVMISHFTTADVSSLSDFHEFKNKFSILRKSFITLDKSVRLNGWKVILRDTSLLSPGNASLKAIGELYEKDLEKVDIPLGMKSNMSVFKKEQYEMFKVYAIQDSVIAL